MEAAPWSAVEATAVMGAMEGTESMAATEAMAAAGGQKRLRTVTTKVRSKTAPYYFYVRGQKRPAVKNGGQKRLRTNSTYV